MKKWNIATGMLFLFCMMPAWAESVIVITHHDTPCSTLTMDEVQRIFLGKKTVWPNGDRIVPVMLKRGGTHDTFLQQFMDMNGSQFDIFWKHVIFTGKGRMPKTFDTEKDIVEFVMNNPGVVGYIDSDTPHSMVKNIEFN